MPKRLGTAALDYFATFLLCTFLPGLYHTVWYLTGSILSRNSHILALSLSWISAIIFIHQVSLLTLPIELRFAADILE